MAVTDITLKPNVFFTLDDVKDHLKIKLDETKYDNKIKRLINMATDLCEKYIDGPIKTRAFVEDRDGDSSDTMVPDYYPMREVTSIKIDYNRHFGPETEILSSNYLVRGMQDVEIGFKGTDVVIRDDNNTSIVGRIFTGSVVGAIRLSYTAGWGIDMNDIPYDLQHAILLAIEYYYLLGENRELNVTSKSNMGGQSYNRETGLPKEARELLDSYKDFSFGRNNKPQKNTFTI